MEQEQPVEQWARTTHFDQPVRWGEIENAILDRRLPPLEDETGSRALRGAVFAFVTLLIVLMYGSAVIGLVAVLIGANRDDPTGNSGPLLIAQISFFASLVVPLTTVSAWWGDGRRRAAWDLLVTGVTGAAAVGAHLVVRTVSEWGEARVLTNLTLVVAVGGLGAFIVLLVASKAGPRPRRRAWSINPSKDMRYMVARRQVLGILVERGVADLHPDMRKKMAEMQLGTWHTLDEPSQR